LTPCLLAATRSTATYLSLSVKNLAVEGISGRKRRTTMPQTMLTLPKMMKTYIQRSREPVVMWPIA
jgi:hypothetical protein